MKVVYSGAAVLGAPEIKAAACFCECNCDCSGCPCGSEGPDQYGNMKATLTDAHGSPHNSNQSSVASSSQG